MRDIEPWEAAVREALETWGAWQRALPGAVPVASRASYAERLDPEQTPYTNEIAERVDSALCKVKRSSAQTFVVLHRYYIGEMSIRDIAQDMRASKNRVMNLKSAGEAMTAVLLEYRH